VTPADLLRFLSLAAIWGSSYMFMRVVAPAFGPLPLVALRLAGAAAFFMPWTLSPSIRPLLRRNAGGLFLVGALNSAIPFSLLTFSMLRLQAGFAAILGATVPLFAVAIDALWWRHPLRRSRLFGLGLGFGGVVLLAWDHLDFRSGGSGWAVLATLAAAACYASAAHFGKHYFAGKPALLPASGSMLAGAILVAPWGLMNWPSHVPPPADWLIVAVLAFVCTALAYLIYYHLIERISATALTGVTYVIPVFGLLWGAIFLHEQVTPRILLGMLVTLAGTAFTTGLVGGTRHEASRPR
jgi:drug/metabolite transporter (DMT)-like permease